MSEHERLETLITGRLLRAGAGLGWLSIGLTVAAAMPLLSGTGLRGVCIGVLVTGMVAAYLAVRVGFDASLFLDASERSLSIEVFDRALTGLRLVAPDRTGRSWNERCRSARRLLMAEGALVVLQTALAAAAGWRF